jgi:hypothetical protein
MDTESRIQQKEIEMAQLKRFIHGLEIGGFSPQLLSQFRVQLNDLEKSLYHEREVHKLEAQSSGRKTWKDDAWKYVTVIIATTFVNQAISYLFSHL